MFYPLTTAWIQKPLSSDFFLQYFLYWLLNNQTMNPSVGAHICGFLSAGAAESHALHNSAGLFL